MKTIILFAVGIFSLNPQAMADNGIDSMLEVGTAIAASDQGQTDILLELNFSGYDVESGCGIVGCVQIVAAQVESYVGFDLKGQAVF